MKENELLNSIKLIRDINEVCIFDIISLSLNESPKWIFRDDGTFNKNKCIEEENFYVSNYGYDGLDLNKVKNIFSNL